MTKVLFIGTDFDNDYRFKNREYGGVSYYRLIKPKEYLHMDIDYMGAPDFADTIEHTDNAGKLFAQYENLMRKYDLVVCKHLDKPAAVKHIFGACKSVKVPIVLDVDDNFLEVLESQPAYKKGYSKGHVERVTLGVQMSMADAIFVSTVPLRQYYQKFLKSAFNLETPIYVLPNCNDINDWNYKSNINKDRVVIGWAGSITHDDDLKMVLPVLNKLATKYDNVYLQFMGGVTADSLAFDWDDKVIDKISGVGGTQSWKDFPKTLMAQKWDIAIAPLVDNEFNRGKSHIKWMEYSMKGIPTVASKVYPYFKDIDGTKTIQHDKTGYLATGKDDWFNLLQILIEDEDVRKEVGQQARKYVAQYWQYSDHIEKWEEAIKKCLHD